jgi:hypothetical protein
MVRNLFLVLLLANVLLFAWQRWAAPPAPPDLSESASVEPSLALVDPPAGRDADTDAGSAVSCVRIGPFDSPAMARRVARLLADNRIASQFVSKEGQTWLGHWVQVRGFTSADAAESARQQLLAGGLPDAYLTREDGSPAISLGVFRDRERAARVADSARTLGFNAVTTDRYRPAEEQWLLLSPTAGQRAVIARLTVPDARILRTEDAPCPAAPESPPAEPPAQMVPEF